LYLFDRALKLLSSSLSGTLGILEPALLGTGRACSLVPDSTGADVP
jgi:hypothetical protein